MSEIVNRFMARTYQEAMGSEMARLQFYEIAHKIYAENEALRADAVRFRFVVDCPIRTHVALSRLANENDDFDLAAECDRLNRSPENPS